MEYRIPKQGEIYRHFKGNLYEIVIIARDSETLEEKVVYKEVGGASAYIRSLPMFVSRVDKEKYPEVKQEFRFEIVTEETDENKKIESGELLLKFLDYESVSEKRKYLQSIEKEVSEELLELIAQALDFAENETALDKRYNALLHYLKTLEKYEKVRIR